MVALFHVGTHEELVPKNLTAERDVRNLVFHHLNYSERKRMLREVSVFFVDGQLINFSLKIRPSLMTSSLEGKIKGLSLDQNLPLSSVLKHTLMFAWFLLEGNCFLDKLLEN